MGNKLLIKRVALLLSITALSYADITINDIDKLVNDIKMERVGLKDQEIQTAKDPFIYPNGVFKRVFYGSDTTKKKRRYRFVLSAIVNDHVKINNRWYKLNSKIKGFKVSRVGKDNVLLTRNNERIRLFLKHSKYKKIKLLVK